MIYKIKNDDLLLSVSDIGGELHTLHQETAEGMGCLWDGGTAWPRRAPVCFPWCSRLDDGYFELDGKRFACGIHGFVRDLPHTLVERTATTLRFRLDWRADDAVWPRSFTFETRHELVNNQVLTTCVATNTDSRPMPCQLGFHTALRCPFTPGKAREDYVVRFQRPEAPDGTCVMALDADSFADDSINLAALKSKWVEVEEAATGNYLRVGTEGYPYVLLWSKLGVPGFLCIEPWEGMYGPGHDIAARPAARVLAPGERFACTQTLTVHTK